MIVGGILLLATLKEGLGFCPVLLSFRAVHNRGLSAEMKWRRDSASRYKGKKLSPSGGGFFCLICLVQIEVYPVGESA
ncbi:MAG: hypothetical protein ACI95K_000702 [Lentimonas sp.]